LRKKRIMFQIIGEEEEEEEEDPLQEMLHHLELQSLRRTLNTFIRIYEDLRNLLKCL